MLWSTLWKTHTRARQRSATWRSRRLAATSARSSATTRTRRRDGSRARRAVRRPVDRRSRRPRRHAAREQLARAGRGFHAPEPFEGREWRWLSQDGVVEVDVAAPHVELELVGVAFSANRERRLTVVDEDGRALGEARVGTTKPELRIGPFRLPKGQSRLRLATTPPPERHGEQDARYGSIFLAPLEIRPLADYSGR